jgi:hypothetical protein
MNAYIGCKIILAEPCKIDAFNKWKEGNFEGEIDHGTESTPPSADGYHVQYSNPDGSFYHSWSPMAVFERAYRVISQDEMNTIKYNVFKKAVAYREWGVESEQAGGNSGELFNDDSNQKPLEMDPQVESGNGTEKTSDKVKLSSCCNAPYDESHVIKEGRHKGHGIRYCSKCGRPLFMV